MAEDHDKNGERTLGVLTKPDLVLEPSAQAAVCELVRGRKRPLTLGYYLVRNRGVDSESRKQPELDLILQQKPWTDLPQDRVGIPALKEQLRLLLVEITQREFPKLLQDVNNQIRECKRELDSLGPPRQDEREQRIYLSHIAGTFQDRARATLAADYNADPSFDQDELRLITQVVNITDVFSAELQQSGHSRDFKRLDSSEPLVAGHTPADSDCEDHPVESMISNLRALLQMTRVDDITPAELVELGDVIITTPHRESMPLEDCTAWINNSYTKSRGLDLGTFNSHFVAIAFTEQSRKWEDMPKRYMSRVIITLHRFITAALRSVFPEEQARRELWSAILGSLVDCYEKAMAKASLLIEVEKRKSPYTLNRRFAEVRSKARGCRVSQLLRPKARKEQNHLEKLQYVVNLDDVAKAVEGKSNLEQLQEEIHDILHAYYGLALDRFVDNVFQLPVDYCLLHGPSSPLKVFTQEWVLKLEPWQLEKIVGETNFAKKRRARLSKKIEDLSKALKILKP